MKFETPNSSFQGSSNVQPRVEKFGHWCFTGCWVVVLGVLLCGCGKSSSSISSHPLPASPLISKAEPGQFGGKLTIAIPGSPRTFNPVEPPDLASDFIARLLFSSLVRMDWASQEVGPGLAESWNVEADGKTWTFHLRQGVRWSDGTRLTVDDVLFTWNDVMLNPELHNFTYEIFNINGKHFTVSKVDDSTVRVVTPEVFAPFLEFFGTVSILPKHKLDAALRQHAFRGAYSADGRPQNIVGCGPYRLREVKPGAYTLLERNPEFWMTDKQSRRLPYIDQIQVVSSGGPGSDAIVFLNGKADVFESIRPELYEQFQASAPVRQFKVLDLGIGAEREFLWFNQNTNLSAAGSPLVSPIKLKWFRNKKFRQAVSCAIDRDRIVREAYHGRAQAIYGFISNESPKWNNPAIPRFTYDPARARSLLAEAGITVTDAQTNSSNPQIAHDSDNNPIEIVLYSNTGNPAREKANQIIVEDLAKVGIKLVYTPLPFEILRQKIDQSFEYEAALIGLGGGGTDPASQINVLKSSEPLHQWFPLQKTPATEWEAKIDALMDAQMRTLDFTARKKAFDEVQAILADELPMIYTIAPLASAAARPNIGNLRPSVMTPFRLTWNIEELFLH